jgi:hypothetical protein
MNNQEDRYMDLSALAEYSCIGKSIPAWIGKYRMKTIDLDAMVEDVMAG